MELCGVPSIDVLVLVPFCFMAQLPLHKDQAKGICTVVMVRSKAQTCEVPTVPLKVT